MSSDFGPDARTARVREALRSDASSGDPSARNMIAALGAEFAAADRHEACKQSRDVFDQMNAAIVSAAYPRGMAPVPEFNSQDGFFPGASGVWKRGGKQPARLIIVGQDFGALDDYNYAVKNGEDSGGPTWRNLLTALAAAGIPTEDCFFTNAIVGLRQIASRTTRVGKKTKGIIGRSPGFGSRGFIKQCGNFLAAQITALRPRGIVLLGGEAAEVFGLALPGPVSWPGDLSLQEWDRVTKLASIVVRVGPFPVKVVRLLHPSLRDANLRYRLQPELGVCTREHVNELEIKLLKDAYR